MLNTEFPVRNSLDDLLMATHSFFYLQGAIRLLAFLTSFVLVIRQLHSLAEALYRNSAYVVSVFIIQQLLYLIPPCQSMTPFSASVIRPSFCVVFFLIFLHGPFRRAHPTALGSYMTFIYASPRRRGRRWLTAPLFWDSSFYERQSLTTQRNLDFSKPVVLYVFGSNSQVSQ